MSAPPGDDKYIRTFAKDMALAEGKPVPETPAATVSAVSSESSTDDARAAVLERLRQRNAAPNYARSAMLPETLPTPVQEPDVKDSPVPAVPEPKATKQEPGWKEGDLPTLSPVTPVPNVYSKPEQGQEVVQRTIVEEHVVAKSELPAAVPTTSYREPIPEQVDLPTVAPGVEKEPLQPAPSPSSAPIKNEEPAPIHTFSSDFANRIDADRASTFSVLAAQADAGSTVPARRASPSRRNVLLTAAGILLLLLAGGLSYGAYRYMAAKNTVVTVPSTPALISADEHASFTGEGNQLATQMATNMQSPLPEGGVRVYFLSVSSTTPTGQITEELPGGYVLGALQLSAPDILVRNIGKESTLGAVGAGGSTSLFMIFSVLSYERTFAGMLAWEPTILSSLSQFYLEYPLPPAPAPTIATTTKLVKGKRVIATTTIEAPAPVYTPPQFTDEVTANHNVRALKDAYGNTVLLYGYTDKQTLVVARNEAAFAIVLNRLTATKTQ